MKFSGKSKDSGQSKQVVLFICIENAGRSAGTKPVSNINPLVMNVMKEVDIDISKQQPKIITEDMVRQSSVTINMGCIKSQVIFYRKGT